MAWRYGDITKVGTGGASFITAGLENGFDFDGVAYSEKMAKDDLKAMNEYKSIIVSVGRDKRVDPAVIAGIISRESSGGQTIRHTGGWGDNNKAYGLMQIDVHPQGGNHKPKGAWDSKEHLEKGTDILIDFIKKIQNKFPKWIKEQQLKGGLAAYNAGDGNIKTYIKNPGDNSWSSWLSSLIWMPVDEIDWDRSYAQVDGNTTGMDYSDDVVARAQWYKKHGY